jgi:hypothetical protein
VRYGLVMHDVWSYVIATLSAGLGAVLVGLLGRTWLTTRIKADVETTYAKKLERYKADVHSEVQKDLESHRAALKANEDRAIEELRAEVASARAAHQAALDAFASAQSAATERRLSAVEALWKATVSSREAVGRPTLVYNILTREEIARAHEDARSRQIVGEIPFDWVTKELLPLNRQVDLLRPFVDEVLWALYDGYRALLGRTVTILIIAQDRGKAYPFWLDDQLVRQVLASLLSPEQLREVNSMQVGSFGRAEAYIEERVITAARAAVSGHIYSAAALQNAREILATAAEAKIAPGKSMVLAPGSGSQQSR